MGAVMWFDVQAALFDIIGPAKPERGTPSQAVPVVSDPCRGDTLKQSVDHHEERAAIHEFDGGQIRVDAERCALAEAASAWSVDPASIMQTVGNPGLKTQSNRTHVPQE